MVRDGLCLLLCAGVLLGACSPLTARPGEETESRIRNQLAVQAAFQKGSEHLSAGNYAAAVAVLESQISLIDGNRKYLMVLREAYRGYIGELQKANRLSEAKSYITRLEILDPSYARGEGLPTPAAMSTATSAAPTGTPVEMSPLMPGTAPMSPSPTPIAAIASTPLPVRQPEKVVGKGAEMPRPRVAAGKVEEEKLNAEPFPMSPRAAAILGSDSAGSPVGLAPPKVEPGGSVLASPKVEPGGSVLAPLGDPFADSNSTQERRANRHLDQAEREFAARRYEEAGKFYEQAYRAEPDSLAGCGERWAYCKLFRVAQALNQPDGGTGADLEREVRAALSMAPKLDGFAKDLLRKIQDRGSDTPRVEVKHTPRQGGGSGWAMAETVNFRILHTQSPEVAERVALVAEATRLNMTRKWFGDTAPAAWTPRCDIYLYPTAAEYHRLTGAPETSPGHSTMSLEPGRVTARRVDLHCDDPNMVTGVLPHETTHVVLAGRFGPHHVPRWADEGMAVLAEPQNRISMHLANLPKHQREGDLFNVGKLMMLTEYPEPRLIGPFYAQGVSLVDFLSRRKGPQAFSRFLRDGLDNGYEVALQRHYEIRSFAELDRLWREHALGGGAVATVTEKVK